MKRLLSVVLAVLVVVASVVLYRGVMFDPVDQGSVDTVVHAVDAQSVALRLSQAIRFATVSQQPPTPTDVGVTSGLIIAGTDSKPTKPSRTTPIGSIR